MITNVSFLYCSGSNKTSFEDAWTDLCDVWRAPFQIHLKQPNNVYVTMARWPIWLSANNVGEWRGKGQETERAQESRLLPLKILQAEIPGEQFHSCESLIIIGGHHNLWTLILINIWNIWWIGGDRGWLEVGNAVGSEASDPMLLHPIPYYGMVWCGVVGCGIWYGKPATRCKPGDGVNPCAALLCLYYPQLLH